MQFLIRSALATLLIAAVSVPMVASAAYRDTSAGGACKAANGANSASFNYSNNYLTNIGTTSQYVICHFAMDDSGSPIPTSFLGLHWQSTQAGSRTITCSAQTGSFYSGVNKVKTAQVRTATTDIPTYGALYWDESTITRGTVYETFTMNCVIAPGMRIGLIEYQG